ncbi:MAG: sensor histidine kinase [Acidimicrobiales bacterium]
MKRPVRVPRSVRARITAVSTTLVAATLVVASLLLVRLVQADLLTSAEETLDTALEEQLENLPVGIFDDDVIEDAEVFSEQPIDLYATVIDGRVIELGLFTVVGDDGIAFGTLFVDGVATADLVLDPEAGEVLEVLDPVTQFALDDAEVIEQIESLAFETIELSEADGQLLVGVTPLQEIEQSIEALRDALLLIVPALVVCFGVLTWWLVGRALRPVQSITEQVQAISTTNLDRRVPVPATDDEVSEMAIVMNRMLDRLERGGERQRRFSADASHELRSPLATIRAAAEVIGRSPATTRTAALSDDIVAEADRMDELIGDLLALSRIDDGGLGSNTEAVDLAELAPIELENELDAGLVEMGVFDAGAMVTGHRSDLRRLVRNLADNALRHAGSRVVVAVTATDDLVELVVSDDGEGVPEGSEALIFERFRRLDEARSRDGGGSGLGLALVASIVESHGGSIRVDRSELGGARFTVAVPRLMTS